ncbi:MAG: hypothetical protein IKO26_09225 [Paludibacteraceae bacterium]|nr:hypothetical protein [Paludibacteraceae bacterium]
MKRNIYILFLTIVLCALSVGAQAQTDTIRYVKENGAYNNDGRSWANATNRLQDAINDLRDYLIANNLTSGRVYVAAGTYVPTESTESTGGTMLNTSFKMYAGISVYGGFNPDSLESKPEDRIMENGKKCSENWSRRETGTTSETEISSQWDLRYKTVLSGNHSGSDIVFTYDSIRGRFNATFPASSYHVVWFGTNGVYDDAAIPGHYRPLERKSLLDGCVITGGNASSRATAVHDHMACGGGAYLVGNAELRNCTIERCNATMQGGGAYLDGGGRLEFCYIHTCQSPGLGVVQGYGGGVCVGYDGSVEHSHITQCAARCGGGLAINHVPGEYPVAKRIEERVLPSDTAAISYYSPFATACVINNNTAAAEAGGIYLAEGGMVNHCTVTANNCIGPDVTYYSRRHGRSGGIYIRNCGMIYNSVFWGNRCATNNDIQFASIRQVSDEDHQVFVYHTAFMNHDISDWTGVQKEMVFSLDRKNEPVEGSSSNYPCFFTPTVNPLNWNDTLPGAGVFAGTFDNRGHYTKDATWRMHPESYPGPRIWHLTSYSALDQKGVQVTDAVQDASQWIRHAHTDFGVVTNPFEPVSTLGALVRKPDPITYALVPQQGIEGRKGNGDSIPTIFIDPNRKGVFMNGKFVHSEAEGNSWETPIRDIGEAISFFRQYLQDDVHNNHHYMLPALDKKGKATGTPKRYDYVQILVKEGSITTAGPGNYLDWNIRTAAVRVESHMRLYGGYPSSLKGTDTSKRNPRDYVTTITANITGVGGVRGYENNAAHVIAMVNAEHTIVDGFTLADANTHNVYLSNSAHAGGGVLVNNASTPQAKRIHMTGNQLRNSVITNCSSPKGAAVYVNGEHLRADGNVSYAELKMENCVIRNNMADTVRVGSTILDHGIVTANGRAYIEIEHCDIVNNVGYPFKADDKKTDDDTQQITCTNDAHSGHVLHGFIRVNNSIVFCNSDRPLDNRGELDGAPNVMSVFPDGQDYVFGEYNMFDKDLRLQNISTDLPKGFFTYGFRKTVPKGFVPGEDEGIESRETTFGASLDATLPDEKNNKAIFTRTNSADVYYPGFVNPSRNVGVSITGDKPLYGGTVSYAPLNTNPCVNAAFVPAYDNFKYDRTDNTLRNRGGAPDIGAIESTDLPVAGAVIYVTPDGDGKRDGSSWSNAIAGNTVYVLNDIAGPALATGDQIDPELTCDRVLDSEGNPILTTNEKYNGGWGKVWMNTHTIYSTTHDATVHDHITYKSIYYGGAGDGEGREVVDSLRESRESLPDGEGVISIPEGFVPGTYDDPRYPYGEISGASRTFWRANPYAGKASDYNLNSFITACNENGWIKNTRAERYVGGLQYAVEKASEANKTYHSDSVQVWVGAGTYNDYKGFVMRDSVTVLGGFPATKYKAPGMSERQALMDTVLNIPKSKPAEKLNAADYESILQISDVNPKKDNTHLETNAVKYWDDDINFVENTTITGEVEADRVITRVYTWQTSDSEENVTAIYYQNSNFHDEDTTNNQTVGDFHSFDFGTATAEKDCWHLTYTGNASTSGNNGVIGLYEPQQMCTETGNNSKNIYENGVIVGKTDKNAMFIRNGSLSGVKVWQTMKNVPAGSYKIVVDLNAYYRLNRDVKADNLPTGVNFIVIGANGDTLVNKEPINAKGKATGSKNLGRAELNRYTFNFTQPATGSLKVSIEIGEFDDKKGNNREVLMENFNLIHVIPGNTYVQTDYSDVRTQHPGSTGSSSSTYSSTAATHRTTLRKRVLTMPDVCVPTYGGGGIGDPVTMVQAFNNDALPHTDRVKGPTKAQRTAATLAKQEDSHYVEYNEATWDGFTIRHGFLYDEAMAHGGGAGVAMYEGAHLRNCIVINNVSACQRVKGAGMFCDGATSTIEGCFVLNNTSTRGSASALMDNQIFAGGMFMYEGTCFNSLFANNYSQGSAGGLGFCVGRFFNNTIAYNTATLVEAGSSSISGGAISLATASNPNLFVANTIIFGNNGIAIRDRNAGVDKVNPFLYCYIQSAAAQPNATTKDNVNNWTKSGDKIYGTGNTFLNGVAPSAENTPFAADFDESGNYVVGRAASLNDFRLRDGIGCVNHGTEEFAGEFYTALRHKGKSDSEIRNSFVYKSVEAAELPDNDVAFADRVQDCQVDIGAYEYDDAKNIKPDTTTHPGKAIYYVMFDSPGGDASADSPKNAACRQKLQKVLDAAGRYKHALMTESRYSTAAVTPVKGKPNKSWTVEVWLEGDTVHNTLSGEYHDWYTPTRSTKHSVANYHDNSLDYSFIIPHGIQVKGGFAHGFYHIENAANGEEVVDIKGSVLSDTTGMQLRYSEYRDPLTYRSVLSGKITSSTGAEGKCFHVVTFTDDLFDLSEKLDTVTKGSHGNQLAFLSSQTDAEDHRALLDGLFIEDGYANSPDQDDRIGGAAVVTGYAHIRNCVVQNNKADAYGGGLYLMPNALVSGTIVKKNTADVGGGIYIDPSPLSLARVFSTTICENSASTTAGGMWFDNTNARINSTAIWHNSANDFANVSGTFTRTSNYTDYPFMFCAVESRRLEGQGNIELSPSETEGVRWDRSDPFNAILYYPIEMSSTLSRSGMPYSEWRKAQKIYTTLDTTDIAGVSRLQWSLRNIQRGYKWGTDTFVIKSNDFIEIGARALNKTFQINVDERYVMRRLYVMHTDLLNSVAARALQDNTDDNDTANMYRQMGSCTLNPFHRLGDAFDYIIAARKKDPAKYRNARFEVYVEKGTFYPYHNAFGEQDEVRTNTFLIPEATTVVGGLNSQKEGHNYCQLGYIDKFTNTQIGSGTDITITAGGQTYTLNYALADSIRLRDNNHRPMRDYNLNSVIEPWELDRQTILSGNAVSGEDFTHVYHVITVHADSTKIGHQPIRYRTADMNADWENNEKIFSNPIDMKDEEHFTEECDQSLTARAIVLDGLFITGGYANHIDTLDVQRHPYNGKTYYRGGGIFIDGNWKESFDDPTITMPDVTDPAKYNIPIVIRNCQFTDNMAGNGGALYSNGNIHVYSSHFTQNYSQGPMTKEDQEYIPWSAGGCIAANTYLGVVNVLFDNNEARRGQYPITAIAKEHIPHADARQGFGGVLSVAHGAKMRVANCHFMRNKAVAYSAIYNFYPNNYYHDADSMQFAFNTLFWGNEVFEVKSLAELDYKEAPADTTIEYFNSHYKGSRAGVFHYDSTEWAEYERLFREYDELYRHYSTYTPDPQTPADTFNTAVTDKLKELRLQADKVEGLYFCSYRKGYGPSAMRPTKEGYLMTKEEKDAYTDARQFPMPLHKNSETNEDVEYYDKLFSYVHGNNNVLINRINTATDGPNFKQPSLVAGIDGYMQNADWLLARMNLTTDQGWGCMRQKVERKPSYYITKYTGQTQYPDSTTAKTAAQDTIDAHSLGITVTIKDVYPVLGAPSATFDGVAQSDTIAMYNYLAQRTLRQFGDTAAPHIPVGDDYYMVYTRSTSDNETTGHMNRISTNPRMNIKDVYIDMGIYEYQYVNLDIKGNEIDTVWVATTEKGIKHDGLSWETPTTDLQGAIDLLMSSHNNHDKYVCFLGDPDQSIAPTEVLDNRRAFVLTSNTLAPLLPDSAMADYDYGVNSITFLGGYDYDVKDAPRDPLAHPTVIEMPDIGLQSQRNQLFVIEDMTRQMVQANWLGEVTSRDSVVIPVVFDGITFVNPYSVQDPMEDTPGGVMAKKGGAAIYYRWQRIYEEANGTLTPNHNRVLHPDSALIDGKKVTLPKLTLSNCIFMDNGARTGNIGERSSAVRIDQGGGSTLIVNSLFHSNAGAPVYAKRRDMVTGENDLDCAPNNVVIVNSTFALNDGHITLEADHNEIHNSLIWLDDLANDTTTQLEFGKEASAHQWGKDNSTTPGIADTVTHNAIWGCFQGNVADAFGNEPLVTDNNSVFEGPYFVSPDTAAATSAARRARNFRINPGVRTMNMADTTVYRDRVFFRHYPDTFTSDERPYWRRSNGFKAAHVVSLKNDTDLAAKPRLFGTGMERGAYECLAVLQRILYVQPNMPAATAGDGSSWRSPFGQGQLQNAIDVAAVYTYLNRTADPETRKAYVFVKGSNGDANRLDIIARDGVSVYGSIPASFSDTAVIIDPEHHNTFINSECHRYVNYVRSVVSGVPSPASSAAATATRINTLTAAAGTEDFEIGFLMDGFVITNPDTVMPESPLQIDNKAVTLRNCLITGNKVSGGEPVVDLRRGLLYNSLLYNDSAAALVRVGEGGLMLNNTVAAPSLGVLPIDSADAADRILNNISGVADSLRCFAPYFRKENILPLPSDFTRDDMLDYQLHERSALVNAGREDLPEPFAPYVDDKTIRFAVDRDLLGNPRRIGSKVDIGALEAWYVEPKTYTQVTSLTNPLLGITEIRTATDAERDSSFTAHYGGNAYPHAGSVVYLMDSSAMTMQDTVGAFEDIFLRPGYMLLKSGASFFGNNHNVQMNYLAAEKKFVSQRYSMTAFPYDYSVAHITSTGYDADKDSLGYQLSGITFGTYQYSGAARSAKDYVFQTENSSLWLPVDTLNRTATEGYLMDFGTTQDTVLRFTAYGENLGDYVYEEQEGELDRIVCLNQYDHRIAGNGTTLDFTRQEDMGWNMKGLPWLVSDYRTDTILLEGNYLRQMYIPHVFYQMDGAGNYMTDGDQIYTSRSWDKGATLSMGNAFFTQTATRKGREEVIFHLPYFGYNKREARPLIRMMSSRRQSDILTAMPDSAAGKNVQYSYGRDGMKWQANMLSPQMYLLDSKRLSRISLLGAAPTEVDIPLGVYVPQNDQIPNGQMVNDQMVNDFTFSLPEKEAFEGYRYVWLIDYALRRYTNLMEEDYTASIEPGTNNTRFAVRIGGFPKTGADGKRQYVVFATDRTLYVRGLVSGDKITVYTSSGKLVRTVTASGSEFTMPLPVISGYVVKVNDTSHKVINI